VPVSSLATFDILFEAFANAQRQLYLVGGCVRDILMALPPKDYDFTTDATPQEIRAILRGAGLKAIPIGEAFGTIATVIRRATYEITTFRVKESYTKHSRHPVVVFGQRLEDDLARRDLTINAMAMRRDGTLIDPFQGERDIRAQRLQVPAATPEKTREIFADDPLRMLRIPRFIARFAFQPTEVTSAAALPLAYSILDVSRERWKNEVHRLLGEPHCATALQWLADVGLLAFILPEVDALRSARAHLAFPNLDLSRPDPGAPSLWEQSLALLQHSPPQPMLRWAIMLHAIGLPPALRCGAALGATQFSLVRAEEIALRFRFSNSERHRLLCLLTQLSPHWLASPPATATLHHLVEALGPDLPLWRDYIQGRLQRATSALEAAPQLRHHFDEVNTRLAAAGQPNAATWRLPPKLGTHLQQHLGLRGQALGQLMHRLKDELYAENIAPTASMDDYLALAHRLMHPADPTS